MGGLDNQIDALKETLRDMWIDFQAEVAKGGENLGMAFLGILEKYGFGDYSGFIGLTKEREELESEVAALQAKMDSLLGTIRARTLSGKNEYGEEISGDYKFWSGIRDQNQTNKAEAIAEREALLSERQYYFGSTAYGLSELQEV